MDPRAPSAKSLFELIGFELLAVTGDVRSFQLLKQRISFTILRGNAASILGEVERQRDFIELFFN